MTRGGKTLGRSPSIACGGRRPALPSAAGRSSGIFKTTFYIDFLFIYLFLEPLSGPLWQPGEGALVPLRGFVELLVFSLRSLFIFSIAKGVFTFLYVYFSYLLLKPVLDSICRQESFEGSNQEQ